MADLIIKGNWNKTMGKLLQEYSELTEDDLKYTEGKEEELVGRLQEKTGKSRDEVLRMINEA